MSIGNYFGTERVIQLIILQIRRGRGSAGRWFVTECNEAASVELVRFGEGHDGQGSELFQSKCGWEV